MSYLKLPRTQLILALFLSSSLLLTLFPEVDLGVSTFFRGERGFDFAASWWTAMVHASVGFLICYALLAIVGIYAFNRLANRDVLGIDLRVVGYLFLVLLLGSGLVVNVILKNGFGRARPRHVVQFGGARRFTPAFVIADECATNCSFSSGDSSGAFFSLALALALNRRRAPMVAAAVYGGLVSLSRIATGAHFLSDTVVSFFVMWITADALYHYLLLARQGTVRAALPAGQGPPERGVPSFGTIPSYARAGVVETSRDAA